MEKVNMKSMDIVGNNIEKIGALFPNCITEVKKDNGKIEKAIDFDKLRQELSRNLVEGKKERYEFTWPDKRQAIVTANAPISKTLRPCREKSVDFDTTQNVYIEGDNLDALKLLQETYLGKIKMIYIDPPYNTGNDFVYEDDYSQKAEDYLKLTGDADSQGNKLSANKDSNGRFHTDWLNLIYPRLFLCKNLLMDDGMIFISIDDNEIESIKMMCNEIFGERCFLGVFVWKRRQMVDSRTQNGVSEDHEYVVCYGKSQETRIRGAFSDMSKYSNPDNDPRGDWMSADMTGLATIAQRPNLHYDLCDPKTGIVYACPPLGWRYDKKHMNELVEKNEVIFPARPEGRPRRKKFAKDLSSVFTGFSTVLSSVFNTQGTREVKELFNGRDYFDFPKPMALIDLIIEQGCPNEGIVMDFFSGSATTAHSVLNNNIKDGKNRKYILVQLPELCVDNSDAKNDGYNTLCDVGEERIRRAGKKIKEGVGMMADSLDVGFRVFKIDDSNMKDIYYRPDEFEQDLLSDVESNIKEDRTPEDLLFQVMIDDLGIPLSAKIETLDIHGKKVFNVENGHLVACFDSGVTDEVITAMAKLEPNYAVLRDSSYESDSVAVNFEQIFKKYSPATETKIL